MSSDLSLLIGSIVGGAGAMLSYWAGWNARDRERQPRGSYGFPPRYRPGYCSINYPDPSQGRRLTNPYSGEPITLTEGSTQSGNRNGGPTKPKPEIVPKPQPSGGRMIGADGMTIGYKPSTTRAMTTNINDTLADRGNRYGDFMGHSEVTQDLKNCAMGHLAARSKTLAPDQQEALDMIFHKIGRIINGDPDYADSWHDIAGYAQLVDNRLSRKGVQ